MVTLFECDTNVANSFAGNDTTLCPGDSIQLGSTDSLQGYSFVWTPGTWLSDSSVQNPMATPQQSITYYLYQTYYNNYLSVDSINIIVEDCSTPPPDTSGSVLFIPNVFSPNGDGFNDIFRVRGIGLESINMKILNRWGNTVFESKDLSTGWDGTYKGQDCAAGVYFYRAVVRFEDGREEEKRGSATLVR